MSNSAIAAEKIIPLSDLQLHSVQSIYGIVDPIALVLYYFFKEHDNTLGYVIDCSIKDSGISATDAEILKLYGIHFLDNQPEAFVKEEVYQFLIFPYEIFEAADTYEAFVAGNVSNTYKHDFCVIEHDFTKASIEEIDFVKQCLRSTFSHYYVYNEGFKNTSTYLSDKPLFNKLTSIKNEQTGNYFYTKDVTEYFTDFNDNAMSVNTYISKAVQIIDFISHSTTDKDAVYYVDYSALRETAQYKYEAIAAYLALGRDVKCYIPYSRRSNFLDVARKAKSQPCMFLSDYLTNLREFPDFSIKCTNNRCYLWVKDAIRMNHPSNKNKYDIILTMFPARIDLSTWTLLTNFSATPTRISLNKLDNIIRFRDITAIGSANFEEARVDYEILNNLVNTITTHLMSLNVLYDDDFVSMSNLLLFKSGNAIYIAYVPDVSGKLPFTIFPCRPGNTSVTCEYNVKDLGQLDDVRLYYDSAKYCNILLGQFPILRASKQYYDEATLRGILLCGMRLYKERISSDSQLTMAEIGVWSNQTRLFREVLHSTFSELFCKKTLLKQNMLSFYGIRHPQISTDIQISDSIWR